MSFNQTQFDKMNKQLIGELQQQLQLPTEEYDIVKQYMGMAVGVGFDAGMEYQRNKHANHMERPVRQLDNSGMLIKEYPSVKEAARAIRVKSHTSIISAIKRGIHCKGYLWRYSKV